MICVSGLSLAGCGSDKATDDKKSGDKEKKTQASDDKVTVVTPANETDVKSPATSVENEELKVDSSPKLICEKFLSAIRKGDMKTSEDLLTRAARNQVQTAGVEMQYPGGERSTCSVTNTSYNSSIKSIAMVQCFVQEPVGGKTETFEFSYLLRKQVTGWRIAGIWMPDDGEGNRDFLSFENSNDVAKMKVMSGDTQTSVASKSGTAQIK